MTSTLQACSDKTSSPASEASEGTDAGSLSYVAANFLNSSGPRHGERHRHGVEIPGFAAPYQPEQISSACKCMPWSKYPLTSTVFHMVTSSVPVSDSLRSPIRTFLYSHVDQFWFWQTVTQAFTTVADNLVVSSKHMMATHTAMEWACATSGA